MTWRQHPNSSSRRRLSSISSCKPGLPDDPLVAIQHVALLLSAKQKTVMPRIPSGSSAWIWRRDYFKVDSSFQFDENLNTPGDQRPFHICKGPESILSVLPLPAPLPLPHMGANVTESTDREKRPPLCFKRTCHHRRSTFTSSKTQQVVKRGSKPEPELGGRTKEWDFRRHLRPGQSGVACTGD